MRRITAIVRPTRLDSVLVALAELGIEEGVVSHVLGSGRQKGQRELHAGAGFAEDLVARLSVQCTVADARMPAVVRALAHAARTGRVGDGKLWVEAIGPALPSQRGSERGEVAAG